MLEAVYQAGLIKRIEKRFPGCVVLKNDPSYIQGIPDLSVFYERNWGTLEVKRSEEEAPRPNQQFYVDKMNRMSFSSFIFPENEKEVLDAMARSFLS